jgi:flagellar L-ring protein precursor FlgH
MSDIKKIFRFALVACLGFSSVNCASFNQTLKSWFGSEDDKKVAHTPPVTSFANQPDVQTAKERKYRRVTKDNFAEDQGLEESAGSLWRKEGQASYLFSQNNLRLMGDIINVDVEGKAADNLAAKLALIKQNLARIENPKPKGKTERQPAGTTDSTQVADNGDDKKAKEAADKKFDTVPCRITERNADGSYRVKGQTPVYVGRHEYRLIVTGLVRPDDVSSDVVGSSKIIDGKFDLVASNKEGRM